MRVVSGAEADKGEAAQVCRVVAVMMMVWWGADIYAADAGLLVGKARGR